MSWIIHIISIQVKMFTTSDDDTYLTPKKNWMTVQIPQANNMFPNRMEATSTSPRAQMVIATSPGVAKFELRSIK